MSPQIGGAQRALGALGALDTRTIHASLSSRLRIYLGSHLIGDSPPRLAIIQVSLPDKVVAGQIIYRGRIEI